MLPPATGSKVTLYVTGKALRQEWRVLREVVVRDNVEIGGHNDNPYYAFAVHYCAERLFGTWYGPRWFEEFDIRRALATVRSRARRPSLAWRNHAFRVGPLTYAMLERNGIRAVSDTVDRARAGPYHLDGRRLVVFPINTLPDHEHVLHGWWTRMVAAEARGADAFGPYCEPVTVERWLEIVEGQVQEIVGRGGDATILAHPLCMYLADGLRVFDALCGSLARLSTHWVSEAVDADGRLR
jgi:hypothetical protein